MLKKCKHCNQNFEKSKIDRRRTNEFCSVKCSNASRNLKRMVVCKNCNVKFEKNNAEIKRTKSGNHFCCKSCAATYNNKHKKFGTTRSKLEKFLESELTKLYPDLDFVFNGKDVIKSELDIYIPSLKLAFELNGVFHYEPIFGEEKLSQIQNNDERKFQACLEIGIELCIIDTSKQSYVTKKTSIKFLDIVRSIIDLKLK